MERHRDVNDRLILPTSVQTEKVIPVARGLDRVSGPRLATALFNSGLSTLEVTVEQPDGCDAIEAIENPSITLGAGSVTTVDQARDAVAAGASFLVSPHFDADVVSWALSKGIVMIPGALTPTEVHSAWSSGVAAVKVFPASAVGQGYVQSLLGPYPDLRLIPTGGVDQSNVSQYLAAGATAVGVGGWLTDNPDPERVAKRARLLLNEVV